MNIYQNTLKLITLTIVVLMCSSAYAELQSPNIDRSEKPGQRKLDNVINGLPKSGEVQTAVAVPEEVNVGELIAKIVFGLIFIVVLIVVLVYLMKKLQGGNFNKLTQGTEIEILEVAPLGQQQKIVSVKVLSKVLVLGVTQQSINTLTTLEDEDAQAYLREAMQTGISSGQFSQSVNQLLSKFKRTENTSQRGE